MYMQESTTPNIRAERYNIVKSQTRCLKWNELTAVFALSAPAGYEFLNVDDCSPEGPGVWEEQPVAAVL